MTTTRTVYYNSAASYVQAVTLADLVASYRLAARALRNLDGGTRATLRAEMRQTDALRLVEAELLRRERRDIVGLLTDERSVLDRTTGKGLVVRVNRPELTARLATTRAALRDATA